MRDQTKTDLLPGEAWRPVAGWPYLCSNYGRVARAETKQLKGLISQHYVQGSSKPNFRFVLLKNKGEMRRVMIGRLVAETWIGPCPKDHAVIYIDRNYNNNHFTNLKYATKEEAKAYHEIP